MQAAVFRDPQPHAEQDEVERQDPAGLAGQRITRAGGLREQPVEAANDELLGDQNL